MNYGTHDSLGRLELQMRSMLRAGARWCRRWTVLAVSGVLLLPACSPTEKSEHDGLGKTATSTASKTDGRVPDKTTGVVPRTPGPAIKSSPVLDEATLARIDEAASPDERARLRAMALLRDGPAKDAPEVIAVFRRGLSDSNPSVRRIAVLGIFDAQDPEGVAEAARLLEDSTQNPLFKRSILTRLRELGAEASPQMMAVGRVLRDDPESSVRQEALRTLESFGLTDRATAGVTVAPWLAAALDDPDQDIRKQAGAALAALGPAAVPELIKALGSTNLNTQWNAIHVVQQIGPPAKDAAAALQPLTESPNERVRVEAQKALKAIGADE